MTLDPKVDKGGYTGHIQTDSNRYSYIDSAYRWTQELVAPKAGFRENIQDGLLWVYVAWSYCTTFKTLLAMGFPMVALALVYCLSLLLLAMVLLVYLREPKDLLVLVYRALLVFFGFVYASHVQVVLNA